MTGLESYLHISPFVPTRWKKSLNRDFKGHSAGITDPDYREFTAAQQCSIIPNPYLWVARLGSNVCITILGHSDLTSRFTTVCNTAVDWVVYGVEKYTSEHAQYLQDRNLSLPSSISLEVDVNKVAMDMAFLRHLLGFFHRVLQPALRKVSTRECIAIRHLE